MQADDSLRRPMRCSTRTRESRLAIVRTADAVPSGESSSTNTASHRTPGNADSIRAPLADLPAHVLVARVLLNYGNPVLRFSEFFAVQRTAAPTSLFYAFLLPLQKFFGPIMDARVYLTIWVAGIWVGVAYLARVLGRRNPWNAALLALPLAFCGYAYQGYLPFLMGFPLFALAVAIWFNGWKPAFKLPARWIVLALLIGFHIVGAAAAGAAISIAALVNCAN